MEQCVSTTRFLFRAGRGIRAHLSVAPCVVLGRQAVDSGGVDSSRGEGITANFRSTL